MDFDHLLREYLSGTLSDRELEQFRSLLENVPEYKAELRQTLEIRSLIHDDAMNLTPPPDLSEHIRIAVGSSFAADALADREQIERKRRRVPYAIRISAGSLVMACLMFAVAFTPTLPPLSSGEEQKLMAVQAPGAAPGTIGIEEAAPPQPATATQPSRQPERRRQPKVGSGTVAFWNLEHEVPSRTLSGAANGGPSAIAENNFPAFISPSMDQEMRSPYSSEVLSHDPAAILYRNSGVSAYQPSIADSAHQRNSSMAAFEAKADQIFAIDAETGRRLAFGVTIGSGQVSENNSPTALLQKSCYMSFSISQNDRIGVEMGASSFQQNERDPYGLGAKTLGSARYAANDLASLTYDPASSRDQHQFLAKQTVGMPSDDVNGGQTKVTFRPTQPQGLPLPKETQRFEQQIAYGGIFYDRRFEVDKGWDLCGRVTVGGADNAIMGNVRAYAAFNPSKNVTLTMGIGGSGLRNFSSKGENFSANYGIYYGIETGF